MNLSKKICCCGVGCQDVWAASNRTLFAAMLGRSLEVVRGVGEWGLWRW